MYVIVLPMVLVYLAVACAGFIEATIDAINSRDREKDIEHALSFSVRFILSLALSFCMETTYTYSEPLYYLEMFIRAGTFIMTHSMVFDPTFNSVKRGFKDAFVVRSNNSFFDRLAYKITNGDGVLYLATKGLFMIILGVALTLLNSYN